MTSGTGACEAGRFEKRYPSVAAVNLALHRGLAAREAGVQTPAVLGRSGPMQLSFARVVAEGVPALGDLIGSLRSLTRMPPDGLRRFDPFLRIRPRLDAAPPDVRALVEILEVQDAALRWPALTVIDGVFHPGQIIRDSTGAVWLLDLDDLALAPPEADLGNLAAWIATRSEGVLDHRARSALADVCALAPRADADLAWHFLRLRRRDPCRAALRVERANRPLQPAEPAR